MAEYGEINQGMSLFVAVKEKLFKLLGLGKTPKPARTSESEARHAKTIADMPDVTELEDLVIGIYASPPPGGKARWSCRSLADKLAHDRPAYAVSHETVRMILAKHCKQRETSIKKWRVLLDKDAKDRITEVLSSDWVSERKQAYARILLGLDEANGRKPTPTKVIKGLTGTSDNVIHYVRKKYALGGIDAVIGINCRIKPDMKRFRRIPKEIETRIVEIFQSPHPDGKDRWTYEEIAKKLMRDVTAAPISHKSVMKVIHKHFLNGNLATIQWRVVLKWRDMQRIEAALNSNEASPQVKKRARVLLGLNSGGGKESEPLESLVKKWGLGSQSIRQMVERYLEGGVGLALYGKKRNRRKKRKAETSKPKTHKPTKTKRKPRPRKIARDKNN